MKGSQDEDNDNGNGGSIAARGETEDAVIIKKEVRSDTFGPSQRESGSTPDIAMAPNTSRGNTPAQQTKRLPELHKDVEPKHLGRKVRLQSSLNFQG